MTTRSLRRLMHLVLASTATETALVACGGELVDDSNDLLVPGPLDEPGSSSSGSSGSSSGRPVHPTPKPPGDAGWDGEGYDAGFDAPPDVTRPDATVDTCQTGSLDFVTSYCCSENNGQPCVTGDHCVLDCNTVCAAVLGPGATGMAMCSWDTTDSNKVAYTCGMCGVGRIPDGTEPYGRGDSVATRLAMQAYYEAASVIAFDRLADALAAARAPKRLVRRARRAARDEERHAELFARLATARGATVPAVRIDEATPSLLDLARENVREGCARETFGALVALHQARHAEDAEVRGAFAAIAEDEIAHAALSWELARWFEAHLGVAPEIGAAIAGLREAATREHDAVDHALGLPEPTTARAMYDALFAKLAA